jgi:3-hydroxyisobutyrate dehydrogenase
MSVGFIGLGNIGKPMAMHWAGGKQTLLVFDVMPQATADLVAAGAKAAATVAELAREAEIIGICVRDDREVEQVLSGTGGILENARPNSVILIHSTVKQESILEWHERGKSRSVHIIDASVTRATEPNKFCYMLGGDAAVVDRCRTLLSTGGNAVVHAGPVGSAIALKLCNNMMTYASFIAIHEAYKLAQAFGIDPELLHQVSNTNGVITPSMAGFIRARGQIAKQGQAVLQAAFGPHGALGKKDMAAAVLSAKKFNVSLPGAQKTEELIADVFVNGY